MTRRAFVSASTAALAAASGRLPIRKAVLLSMLPDSMGMLDRFISHKEEKHIEAPPKPTVKSPMRTRQLPPYRKVADTMAAL